MASVEVLTGMDIEFGRRLWQALRSSKEFPTNGVFWLLQSESGIWHLLIATPRVDEVGPRDAYAELLEIMKRIDTGSSQFFKVELTSPKHPFYQALRSVFGKTASVEGARLGGSQVGGTYIADAYLYEIR